MFNPHDVSVRIPSLAGRPAGVLRGGDKPSESRNHECAIGSTLTSMRGRGERTRIDISTLDQFSTMFTEVGSVAVLVNDATKAAEWYKQQLGFETSVQGHWVTAKPRGSNTVIHLCAKNEDWENDRPGGQTGIFVKTDDKEKTYRELKSRGVEFDVELMDAPWGGGKYAIFKDLDGNKFWM